MPRSSKKKKKWASKDLDRVTNQKHETVFERKIKNCEVEDTRMERSTNNIFNMHELQGGIFRASICGECRQGRLIILENQREGWASEYTLKCDTCEALTNFNSSRQVTDGRAHQVNRALTLGMRAIGRGQTAAATLAGFLNLPPPISAGPWAKHTSAIVDKMSGLIDEERLMAARRLKRIMLLSDADDATPEDCLNSDSYIDSLTVDVAVSFDGSWKDRGYSSHHGVVAAISQLTGEVLDVEYLCNHCSECNKHSTDDVTSTEYFQFQIAHLPHCGKKFQGTAGGMEVEGVIRLYERSKETNLQYTKFIGDGDCKSFSTIKNLQPYGPEVMISKEECVGHFQKRMGARLRRVRDKLSGQKLSDGKAIGGQGRLTLARCNAFQYFYGKCLRENKGHPEKCSREAMAILDHYSEGGDHRNCPERYCRPDRMPTEKPLPSAVVDVIKPTFKDLSDINLLQKCSEAATQNANESFHSLLWRLVPKEGYNSVTEIMLGVHMAQLYYNQGRMNSNMRLFSVAGLNPSLRLQDSSRKSDFKRMENGRRAAEEDGKKRRLELHGTKKIMGFKSKSDKSYSSGAYHSGLIEG